VPDIFQLSGSAESATQPGDAAAASELSILVKVLMKLLFPQPLAPHTSKLTGVLIGRMLSLGLMELILLCGCC
jgi:hypothetical protein